MSDAATKGLKRSLNFPFLFLFASMIRLEGRPGGPEVIWVWGGRPVAIALAWMGMATAALTIVLSVIPSGEETNKAQAVAKVLISTVVLAGAGVVVFAIAERKKARTGAE